jgi:hypothetical protein
MKLTLKRIAFKDSYTIGRLFVDGVRFCDTLEDKVRDTKIKGETAIPYGTYEVTLKVKSPKFSKKAAYNFCGGYLPRLLDVPNFEGILIHIGNTSSDTEGCILVGENKQVGKVLNSTATFKSLYAKLKTATDKITIEITK